MRCAPAYVTTQSPTMPVLIATLPVSPRENTAEPSRHSSLTAAKRNTLTADTLTVQRWPEDEPDSPDVTMHRVTDAVTLPRLSDDRVRKQCSDAGALERRWTITATDAGFTYTFFDSDGKFEMTRIDLHLELADPQYRIIRMVAESVPRAVEAFGRQCAAFRLPAARRWYRVLHCAPSRSPRATVRLSKHHGATTLTR